MKRGNVRKEVRWRERMGGMSVRVAGRSVQGTRERGMVGFLHVWDGDGGGVGDG